MENIETGPRSRSIELQKPSTTRNSGRRTRPHGMLERGGERKRGEERAYRGSGGKGEVGGEGGR